MKIMVLGGGSCQLNLIKELKKRNHYVILIDYLVSPLAKLLVDIHLQISTFDNEGVYLVAKKYNIEGIVTLGTDQPVLTCAYVAKRLHLPFYLTEQQALEVTNKLHMKKIFTKNQIPTVKYVLLPSDFRDEMIKKLVFPVIMKPVDSQGQRGIFKCESINDIREKIKKTLVYSRENVVLIEEYYPNDEITINGWLENDQLTILSVVDRVTINNTRSVGVCLCHNFPSVHLKTNYDQIEKLTKKIIKAFLLKNGPIYFQYLLGDKGIKVNEIAMRIGGAYEDLTMPIISQIDILELLITKLEKKDYNTSLLKKYNLAENQQFISTQLFFCHAGQVKSMTPIEQIKKEIGVTYADYIIKPGDEIGSINNATARVGYFIVTGTSYTDLIKNINNTFDKLQVLDQNGHNLIIKYKDYNQKYMFFSEDSS
ncbi:MAG: ATP-grasp domain-containing protein [Clostridiales bacterium]|nr:ATP-grasp domain-containing protein [Clostridiales bacterium]